MLNPFAEKFTPRQATRPEQATTLQFACRVAQRVCPFQPEERVLVYLPYRDTGEDVPRLATVQSVSADNTRITVLYDEADGMTAGQTCDLYFRRQKVYHAQLQPEVAANVMETNRHYLEKRDNPEPLPPWEEVGLWEGGKAW